ELKIRNAEYHYIVGGSRVDFWNSIANKINERFRTTYTGHQCKDKFRNLVNNHNVNISRARYVSIWLETDQVEEQELLRNILMNFVPAFGKDQVGLHPTLKVISDSKTRFDQIHNANTSARRREESQRSRTPPPSYEEVSSMLDRREVSASHRGVQRQVHWQFVTDLDTRKQ
ncbi:4756_t:CDS:2, partial [Entrophospora sp. SA101]